MTTPDLIKKTLDHLLSLPENKDGVGLQLVMGQNVAAGALRAGPVEGVYTFRVVAQKDKTSHQKVMIDMLVPATEIQQIHMAVPEDLIKPVGGIITP